ncbi:MAG TPA: hypothetical protein VKQ28_06320 [Candidatus Acidoferrum sp.]|nr:hypothetical protein [Candidatus Acidoferrum sp.]
MRILRLLAALVFATFFCSTASHAQGVELFGGYSFVRAPVTFNQAILCPTPSCPTTSSVQDVNLNGWEFGGALKLLGPLALAADFSRTSGSFQGASPHLQTYLVGPQLRLPGPISPFVHALAGAAHESISTSAGSLTFGPTQTSFATVLGGGIDLKVLPFISLRPIQIDYLLTHFNSNTQNQFRVSAGVVVHF